MIDRRKAGASGPPPESGDEFLEIISWKRKGGINMEYVIKVIKILSLYWFISCLVSPVTMCLYDGDGISTLPQLIPGIASALPVCPPAPEGQQVVEVSACHGRVSASGGAGVTRGSRLQEEEVVPKTNHIPRL